MAQSTTEATPFNSKGRKRLEPWLKEYTWLVCNRDDNLCIVKSLQKLRSLTD